MMQDWSPPKGLLVRLIDEDGTTTLPNGKPKPCKLIPMKNVKDIIKAISGFIHYGEALWVLNVCGSSSHRYETWIGY